MVSTTPILLRLGLRALTAFRGVDTILSRTLQMKNEEVAP